MGTIRKFQERLQESVLARPTTIAAENVRLWKSLARELAAIIGENGFQALYLRCVHKARADYPWLDDGIDTDFSKLKSCLEQQEPAQAAAGGIALLTIFTDTLYALIGESLTTTILLSAWGRSFLGTAAKETQHER
jgi:hypothetical protein